jgi:DNA polymerase III epsilon subunit-like protein
MADPIARREAIHEAQRLLQARPVYLDTETTGTGPSAEVIEVGVVDDQGEMLYSSLVRPRGPIEPEAMRVHNITPDLVADAPGWSEIWPELREVLHGQQVGAYNSDFDLRLIKQSLTRAWLRWDLEDHSFFCIMKLYARFTGEWDSKRGSYRWHSLDSAGRQAGIPLGNTHRALDDARLARALLHYMAEAK